MTCSMGVFMKDIESENSSTKKWSTHNHRHKLPYKGENIKKKKLAVMQGSTNMRGGSEFKRQKWRRTWAKTGEEKMKSKERLGDYNRKRSGHDFGCFQR